jgi:2-amino-4-hydroxy-6-hydroxymethyldihydropteridine diphosphokinase
MTTPAWIGLGSNLGDRRAILDAAIAALDDSPGVAVRAVSSYHETAPVGGPTGQGPFLNAAAHLETTLDPHQLLATLQGIENRAGRVRTVRWGERTLDLDILIYGCKFLETRELKLPHPRLAFRRFVLEPLAEIAPEIVDTVSRWSIADLLANLDRRPRLLVLEATPGRRKETVFRRLVDELPAFGVYGDDLEASEADNPFERLFAAHVRKVEAFTASRSESERLGLPWIVADFSLNYGLLRASINIGSEDGGSEPPRVYREGMRRLKEAANETLEPTLAIILAGDRDLIRKPGFTPVPRLWPESDKPDAIVAEVVATCRSIESS